MIGIITAVKAERDAVLKQMKEVKASTLYDIEFYEGVIRETHCIMVMCGVGKVNAARCTQLMIDRFNPERIVNVGSAGALHPDLNIGDVVISTSCVQHDVDLTPFGWKKGALAATGDGFIEADAFFMEMCKEAMDNCIDDQFKVYQGPIATGDQFNDSLEKQSQLFEDFGAYCGEMEGAAVAQVCSMCQIPFVVIRSISDKPNKDTLKMYQNFSQLASERCADFLVSLVHVLEREEMSLN